MVPSTIGASHTAIHSYAVNLAQHRIVSPTHDCASIRQQQVRSTMPKIDYDPQADYDDDDSQTYEPNRARKIRKFKREREQELEPNEKG